MAMLWPLLTIMCLQARAQQQEYFAVTGKVISAASGRAIAGATVANKRTRKRVMTDRVGEYRISARPDDILMYSYIGYVTAEEEINGREVIIVALDSAENLLQEVEINAGYYTVSDRERTGSIARVTAKDIEKQPVLNPLEALKGRMASVDIQQTQGEIGSGFTVRIRGENSLRTTPGVNDPLYLIDGVPFTSTTMQQPGGYFSSNPLNTLSPNDIASIDVLKDADATAIYGSRGANGVVLITTKKGQVGAARLTVDANFGAGEVRKFMDLLDTDQYLEMRREAYANTPSATPTGSAARDLLVYDQEKYTDWQRELLGGTAGRLDTRASLSGGTDAIRYLLSGSFLKQGNVYPGGFGYTRGSGHASLRTGSDDGRFHAQLAITYSQDHNNLPNFRNNIASLALTLPPNAPDMLDENGNINWPGTTFTNNPMGYFRQPYNQTNRNSIVQALIAYRIINGLVLKINAGYNLLGMQEELRIPASAQNPLYNPQSVIEWKDNRQDTWNVEPQLEYKHEVGNGQVQLLVGTTVQSLDATGSAFRAFGFPNEQSVDNKLAATTLQMAGNPQRRYRYLAAFARINYGLKDRYFLNLTARRDGSSRFGPGKRWGNFGAAGVAWLFAEEAGVKRELPWLSFGKLRASYGITGSDQIDDYGYLATYSFSNSFPYQLSVVAPTRLANANYRWETSRKLEAALELGVLHDRVRATLAWYRNRSGNQLVGYPLPAISGFTSVQHNLPAEVQNSGWEVELHSVNLRSDRFEWNTAINLSFPRRKLLAYPNIEASSYATTYQVGESMDRNRMYRYLGVDPETGMYEFEDVDGSGSVNDADRIWRNKYRTMYGGVHNNLRYRGVTLSISLQLDKRERRFEQAFAAPGRDIGNQPVEVMDRWQQPGDDKPIQRFSTGFNDYYVQYSYLSFYSDAWQDNLFFVRLSNVALAWQLPSSWCSAMGVQGLRLSASGQNLWVSDRRNRMDPEVVGLALPLLRVITGGIQLTF